MIPPAVALVSRWLGRDVDAAPTGVEVRGAVAAVLAGG
jgi:hypothetical protein